ncbi:MAG: hypothetical protein LKK13_04560 [Bacilli bacterium]|jgi:hypothetical protein|nr:hypothetical protein [Bacilli bacterium]
MDEKKDKKNGSGKKASSKEGKKFLKAIVINGVPYGPLSVKQQKALMDFLDEGAISAFDTGEYDSASYRLGFSVAVALTKVYLCTGGGKRFKDTMTKLGKIVGGDASLGGGDRVLWKA